MTTDNLFSAKADARLRELGYSVKIVCTRKQPSEDEFIYQAAIFNPSQYSSQSPTSSCQSRWFAGRNHGILSLIEWVVEGKDRHESRYSRLG
jgi:hypothetical protein